MKRFVAIAVLIVGLLTMVACGAGTANGGGGGGGNDVFAIATGGTGGTYYAMGGAFASLLDDVDAGFRLLVESTAASTENIRLLNDQDIQFAIVQPDSAFYAYEGSREFEEKVPDIRGIMVGHRSLIHPVVRADSGINSFEDLRGKTIALSAPASPQLYSVQALLEAHGLEDDDYEGVLLTYVEQASALQDNTIDAAFIQAGAPASAVTELASSIDIKLLSVSDGVIKQLLESYPYFSRGVIPGGTYQNQDEDVTVLAMGAMLVAHASVDDDVVYTLTKLILENTDKLAAIHPAGKEWVADTATEGAAIPFHPGAERYLREIGLLD